MSYYSNVKLLIAGKGYQLLEERCLSSTEQCVKDMILKANEILTDDENNFFSVKGSKLLFWADCKWYAHFKDVGTVLSVLKELDEIVEKEPDKLEDYFYKMIEIEENNTTNITTNDEDEKYTEDFYVECYFSI